MLSARGFSADEVGGGDRGAVPTAVAARAPGRMRALADPIDALRRAEALQRVRREMPEDFAALAEAFKRAKNILAQQAPAAAVDPALFEADAERVLFAAASGLERAAGSYEERLRGLASLRAPVGRFFDDVLVMAEDARVRANRLALLNLTLSLFYRIADISQSRRYLVTQYVFFFGGGKADGNKDMKDTLGGKGAGLAEMTNAGVPVPPGFTISTQACNAFYESKGKLPAEVDQQMIAALEKLEALQGKKLGDPADPLLVSVRSGSKFSMPGMMDTILNLGMNDSAVGGVEAKTGNPRFARDSYRRFIQMYGNVVLGIDKDKFEHELSAAKKKYKAKTDVELDAKALDEVIVRYKAVVQKETGKPFPQDAREQLVGARDAVFESWMNPRAITYRKLNDIPHNLGTAVNVQTMVFGNMGDSSATGVGFTRNPSNGAKEFYGEFLQNAQGEDVVSGVRTPHPIKDLEALMPAAYKQLREITTKLERHYKDVQDFEFTIQENTLYMLQTRNGKRTGLAAVQIAVDMCEEGLITKKEALLKVEPQALDQLLHPIFDAKLRKNVRGRGEGPAGLAGRGHGRRRLHGRRRGGLGAEGQEGPARPDGDGAGRHPRHVGRAGHPDRHRRHDVARGRRRPPDGQALGRRLRRARHQRQGQDDEGRRQGHPRRRPRLDRRLDRRGDARGRADERVRGHPGRPGPAEAREVGPLPEVREAARRGPTRSAGWASARTPTSRATPRSPSRSAPAASACAAPSTCSSPTTACRTWSR